MFWIIFLFLNVVATDNSQEKFKLCNNQQCILIQCYFPVPEFLNATRNEIKLFENFLDQHHIFISYYLCNDLTIDNIDEVGACIYGVLFKLYQFDANLTIHQRIQVQSAQIQEESVAVVMDMISTILYRIQSINDTNKLKNIMSKSNDEDIVVINAQSLTAQVHFTVSRTILNYGQWFTFIYSIDKNNKETIDCLYQIYPFDSNVISSQCVIENNIRMILEQRIRARKDRLNIINSFSDLTHVNVFQRTLSTLFYIHTNSTFTLISNKNMIIIPVIDIDNHVFLHGPYPFYLFWSAKKNIFQRLGDQPSNELLDILIQEEQKQHLENIHGMFDDEVRYIADAYDEIEIDPNVLFLKNQEDYYHNQEKHLKNAILFTVKWDSTSKLARKTFHQLALYLHNYLSMIDIDCFDWTDICNEENIFEWPTLILTENKTIMKIYQGSTDKNEMALALFRFSVNQPYLIDDDSSETLIENILTHQRLIILAQIQHQEKFLYDTYKNLVDMFLDNEHIFFMFKYSTESSSLIIKQKYGDITSFLQPKTIVHALNEDLNHLQILISDALRIPMIPFDPMDIIKSTRTTFLVASHSQLIQLNDYFLLNNPSTENLFVWIDTNSLWVLTINQYGHIPYPAVIYINDSNGKVYMNSTLNDIDTWLKTVQMGSIEPFYELSSIDIDEGPSQKEIDFNKQTYDEQLLNEYRIIHEESEKINEYGIGFDMNGFPVEMNN
ncbi:unnamed protein product [Rotaria sordida]|uniref:Thioredoxin domain-containing protein n=1 Tax=Rotaria sordida TaxID=392033 RepID=A0A814SJM5_9BILA|nr:unnamed protein product [Rotaria sordida]